MSINKLIVLYLQWSLNFDSWWIKIWFKFINSSQFSTVLACFIKKEQTRMLNDKKMTRWKRVKKMWLFASLLQPPEMKKLLNNNGIKLGTVVVIWFITQGECYIKKFLKKINWFLVLRLSVTSFLITWI